MAHLAASSRIYNSDPPPNPPPQAGDFGRYAPISVTCVAPMPETVPVYARMTIKIPFNPPLANSLEGHLVGERFRFVHICGALRYIQLVTTHR